MTGIVISLLVAILFALDLILGFTGPVWAAPFRSASVLMDVLFLLCAGGLGYLSWSTLKEQD
jgi:hypothetical protein